MENYFEEINDKGYIHIKKFFKDSDLENLEEELLKLKKN